jgi:RNA polymerase sigma-70 factor (ECF subfamily)
MLARHRAVDALRGELRRAARQERSYQLSGEQPARSACEEAMAAEAVGLVRDAVRALPEDQRQVVELAYFAGLSCREVAREVGIPEGTAKSRLRLARARLEAMLDRELLESS